MFSIKPKSNKKIVFFLELNVKTDLTIRLDNMLESLLSMTTWALQCCFRLLSDLMKAEWNRIFGEEKIKCRETRVLSSCTPTQEHATHAPTFHSMTQFHVKMELSFSLHFTRFSLFSSRSFRGFRLWVTGDGFQAENLEENIKLPNGRREFPSRKLWTWCSLFVSEVGNNNRVSARLLSRAQCRDAISLFPCAMIYLELQCSSIVNGRKISF